MKIINVAIGAQDARLTGYIQEPKEELIESSARPAVLIFPGGGYEFVSNPENEPVALSYSAKGFQAFVLQYSVKEKAVFPAPQREAFEAIAYLRAHADELHIDPKKIAVVGFSAGGHLAASTAVHWKDQTVNPVVPAEQAKPDAQVLVYPCITAGEYAYAELNSVHGKGTAYPEKLSLENYVDSDTPPAFICHTAADTCVPAMNSLLYATALAKSGVSYELRIYKDGPHGMSLANKAVSSGILLTLEPPVRQALLKVCARFSEWFEKSVEFLRTVFDGLQ